MVPLFGRLFDGNLAVGGGYNYPIAMLDEHDDMVTETIAGLTWQSPD